VKLYYSIENKKYDEYVCVDAKTQRAIPNCSFWGFTTELFAMYPIPIGDWQKSRACPKRHTARDFLRNISETVEPRKGFVRFISSKMKLTPKSALLTDSLFASECHYASIPVYTPISDDDIHLAVDVVWKWDEGHVKVLSAHVQLKGALAKSALFAKNEDNDNDVSGIGYDDTQKVIFGNVLGNLYYYLGDKEVNVLVRKSFELKI